MTQPSGLVRTTTVYPDGRGRSVTEDGIIKSSYDFGVNADGTQWTKGYTGPAGTNSPMWQKTTSDFLSRTARQERPGFGGVALTNAYIYNALGQLGFDCLGCC